MTSRRASLPELSAYRSRRRAPFPWRNVRLADVLFGFVLVGAPVAVLIVAIIGWAG